MKSSRVSRVIQLLTTLQAGKNYTASDLAKIFSASRRTIFRDLKELQAIGVPYRYCAKTGGYTIDPGFFLPPIDLNLQEALSLLLLVYKASSQIQAPFRKSALMATLKIESNLPTKIKQCCGEILRSISTRSSAQASTGLLDKIFAQLQDSITKKRKVDLEYHSLFEGKVIRVDLCPYHLMYNHRAWYVLGFSNLHNSIRTFKLS